MSIYLPFDATTNPTITTDSPLYRKAFEQYLRKGTPMEISLKMMIARTETTANHSTERYIWRTAGDGKVRPSHAANNGQVFSWDDPPETGNPGDEPGCRCVAIPLPTLLDALALAPALIPVGRLGRGVRVGGAILGRIGRRVTNVDRDTLTPAQTRNLERFDKKLPKDAQAITVERGANGQRIFRADVPARNIPGSFARYEKVVDRTGNTVSYTKTTYGPNGEIIGVKVKFGE